MEKHFLKVLFLFTFLLSGLYLIQVNAVPACPDIIHYKQPDGSILSVLLKGDEKINFFESIDGYTLLKNNQGTLEFAVMSAYGDLVPSGIQAFDPADRPQGLTATISTIPRKLRYSPQQRSLMLSIMNTADTVPQKSIPTTGNIKFLVILMQFPGQPFTKTQTDFNNLFNQVGYLGTDKGSVRDFYKKDSYGKLDIAFTVVGPFTAANNIGYYSTTNSRPLITEAVNFADPYVNFADFDNDKDGTVDGIHMIFAGYGAENGVSNTIWSHAWYISGITKDGVNISNYCCSPEFRGASGTTITAIGVACHELGHVLGAPDYYDTDDFNGGYFNGTGNWDMMAGGSWNISGDIPATHNAYTKVKVYHWATAAELISPATVSIPNSEDFAGFYIINSTTPNEYWIMENKQSNYLPGKGLLIYHVDKDINLYSPGNMINTTYPQRMYPVCANAGTNPGNTAASYGIISSSGCPFPGTGNITEFTDSSLPGMISWAGANTGKPITNIRNGANKTITFDFMGYVPNVPVTGVSLNTNSLILSTGQSYTLTAIISPSNATNKSVIWTSNNSGVATVSSSSGVVTAAAEGSAVITATTQDGGKTAVCAVTVQFSNYLSLNKTAISSSDESNTLTPNFATDGDYDTRWSSAFSDPQWIYVDLGAVYKVTRVKLAWEYAYGKSYKIQVSSDASSWTDVYTTTTGDGGIDDFNVTATNGRYVRMYGTVRASLYGYSLYEFEVYGLPVTIPVTGVSLSSTSLSLKPGQASILTATVLPADATNKAVIWESGNTSVATVNSNGVVTAVAAGLAVITVTTQDGGKTAACQITVQNTSVTYCIPTVNSSIQWISLVKIGTINNATAKGTGYSDYTNLSTNIASGTQVLINLVTGWATTSSYWKVWIDYNRNGSFTDNGEAVVDGFFTGSSINAYFNIPSNTYLGATRMRVMMVNSGTNGPCSLYDGEVEDYTVNITAN